jgi:hypothetical protein
MPRGLHAADHGGGMAFAPSVEFTNLFPSFEAIVTYHHDAVGQIEFVRAAPAIAIDLVPISRLQAIEGVPELDLFMGVHFAPLPFDESSDRI